MLYQAKQGRKLLKTTGRASKRKQRLPTPQKANNPIQISLKDEQPPSSMAPFQTSSLKPHFSYQKPGKNEKRAISQKMQKLQKNQK